MEQQMVIFELESEKFGVEIACVEGIVKLQEITRVPNSPDFIEGITSLRGSVLPVMDLAKRFGMEAIKRSGESRIVVILFGGQKIGLVVSSVSEVVTFDDSIIEPPPPLVSSINTEYISGIARFEEKLIILLNLENVLTY